MNDRASISATISAGVDGVFAVDLGHAATALREEETFRFALHYYGRALYELAHAERSVRRLPEWIARIASTPFDSDDNLFLVAGIDGALVRTLDRPIATAQVTMTAVGVRDREIHGDLSPLRGSTLARSVIAVLQSVLPHLSDAMLASLPAALANMNASYEMTHRYGDPRSHREVPAVAYLAASFV